MKGAEQEGSCGGGNRAGQWQHKSTMARSSLRHRRSKEKTTALVLLWFFQTGPAGPRKRLTSIRFSSALGTIGLNKCILQREQPSRKNLSTDRATRWTFSRPTQCVVCFSSNGSSYAKIHRGISFLFTLHPEVNRKAPASWPDSNGLRSDPSA